MQSPHPEMCGTKADHNLFSLQKKRFGDMKDDDSAENWITEENGGQAKFNVIKCVFSIKSQVWVENY